MTDERPRAVKQRLGQKQEILADAKSRIVCNAFALQESGPDHRLGETEIVSAERVIELEHPPHSDRRGVPACAELRDSDDVSERVVE